MNWNKILTIKEWHKLKAKEDPPKPIVYEKNNSYKLTAEQKNEIRARLKNGEKLKVLAIDYGVSQQCIWRYKK